LSEPDSKFYSGHRDRLRQKFLDGKLVDYEKLELLLGYAIPRRDTRPLAHALIKRFGSLPQVLTAQIDDLLAFPGIGHNTAVFLKLVQDIVLSGYRATMDTRPIFHDIKFMLDYCWWTFANKPVEEFHVLYLDSDFRLLQDQLHSSGTYNTTGVYVREIIKTALKLNATSVVLVHNHPASDNSFSNDDIEVTEEIEKIFNDLDISLFDHFLVTKHMIYSGRDCGIVHGPRKRNPNSSHQN